MMLLILSGWFGIDRLQSMLSLLYPAHLELLFSAIISESCVQLVMLIFMTS